MVKLIHSLHSTGRLINLYNSGVIWLVVGVQRLSGLNLSDWPQDRTAQSP